MVRRTTVRGVRCVEIEMSDPERAARFYVDVWNLTEVDRAGPAIYLRGTCAYHHILAIHPSNGPAHIRRIVFDAADRGTVDTLHADVAGTRVVSEEPHALDRVDGGYGFGFQDPGGRNMAIVCDAKNHPDDKKFPDRPYKIAHVNVNTALADETTRFLINRLGFRLVDHAGSQYFFNADCPDHSSIVICESSGETLNHVAYEMPNLESVMRGAGRMRDNGYPIEWGVGRHGAGNNVFAYFAGPEEFPIEYTGEVLQIDDTYPFNGPEYWKWPSGRLDQWGVTPPHTTRWKRIQTLYTFTSGAYQL